MYLWKKYQRFGMIEARPYVPGEDLSGVSVSDQDKPTMGDMIARNPDNPADQWLINDDYFSKHYKLTLTDQGSDFNYVTRA